MVHRTFTVLIFSLLLVAAAACTTVSKPVPAPEPASRPSAAPPSRGKELGKQFLLEARKQYRFVKDQDVVDAVNEIGRRLVTAAGGDPQVFHFFVVSEIQPNAFAIPGGYIFIFDGLLARLNSEDELAGVLAHEIGHVTHNHFFKDEAKLSAMDLATIAAILLSRGNEAATSIAIAANITAQLQFSRENEEEADASAIEYLKAAGYHPQGMLAFFQTLVMHEDIHQVEMPAYLSTHPALRERIQLVEVRMNRPSDRILQAPMNRQDWPRLRTVVRARTQNWQDAAQLFPERPPGAPPDEQSHAMAGLAYLTADRPADAITEYQAALSSAPSNPVYHADLALAYLKAQNVEKARSAALESLKRSKPGDEPLSADVVIGLLEEHDGRWAQAVEYFDKVIRKNPDHAFAHYHIGQAYFQLGEAVEGAYHTGRYLRLNLEPEAALKEFQRARKLVSKDHPLASKIQDQIDQITADGI